MTNARLLALLAGTAALLGGCAVGPNHVPPEPPVPVGFSGAQDARFSSQAVTPQLWRSFGEPELNALIERALAENRSLSQARARLDEARALRGLTVFGLFPTVTAAAERERSEPSSLDPFLPAGQAAATTYRSGFDASWEIDVFGASRRAAAAARGEASAREADWRAVQAATVAEVAQAWFALRGAEQRRALEREALANFAENLRILERQLEAGRGTDLDVSRARGQLADVAARLPDTDLEVTRQEQRLAVLVVASVEQLRTQWLAAERAVPSQAPIVAVGSPEDWLRRRPDIRAAEQRLAAATARIGVEQAQWWPRITLLGGFGYTAQDRDDLFTATAERWRYGPSLTWSFLDAGRVRQRVRAARSRAAGALAAYDETVLRALEETENAFAAYRAANQSLAANEAGLVASRRAAELAAVRYDAGASDFLVVLDAERSRLDFQSRVVQSAVARATALAAINKALAGDFAQARDAAAPASAAE